MGREDIRRQMTTLARRWEARGHTQRRFAERQGVSYGKFRYWVSRRIGRRPRRPLSVQRFAISRRWQRSNVAGVIRNACQRPREQSTRGCQENPVQGRDRRLTV